MGCLALVPLSEASRWNTLRWMTFAGELFRGQADGLGRSVASRTAGGVGRQFWQTHMTPGPAVASNGWEFWRVSGAAQTASSRR